MAMPAIAPAIAPAPAPAIAEVVPVSRPAGLWLLTVALLVGPIVHLVALWLDRQWINFGSRRPRDGFVYLLIAPLVGTLMLRRHERARFSVYVFLSCEVLRALRIRSLPLGLLAVAAVLYLQLPTVRRFHPSVDPRRVLERIRPRRRDRAAWYVALDKPPVVCAGHRSGAAWPARVVRYSSR